MALTFPIRSYAGGASAGTLSAGLSGTATSFSSSTSLANWSDVAGAGFQGYVVVEVEPGTANAEKILCTYPGSGNTLNIATVGGVLQRNYDGSTFGGSPSGYQSGTHPSGSTFILVASATELAEANAAVQAILPILRGSGTATTTGTIGIDTTPSTGTTKTAVPMDHQHNLPSSQLNSWLSNTASGALASGTSIGAQQVTAGTLPSGVQMAASQLTAGTLASGVQMAYSQLTGTPQLATAGSQAGTSNVTATTSVPTSGVLSAAVNPNGVFANYVWFANATQGNQASANINVSAVLFYRVAGSGGTWNAGATLVAGVATTTLNYNRLSVSGVLQAPVSGTDYEFQLGFTTNTGSVPLNQFNLTVIGTN